MNNSNAAALARRDRWVLLQLRKNEGSGREIDKRRQEEFRRLDARPDRRDGKRPEQEKNQADAYALKELGKVPNYQALIAQLREQHGRQHRCSSSNKHSVPGASEWLHPHEHMIN